MSLPARLPVPCSFWEGRSLCMVPCSFWGSPSKGSLFGGLCWRSLCRDLCREESLSVCLCPWGLCLGGTHPTGILFVLVSVKNILPFLILVWNLVTIAFERYLAVCHPFKHSNFTRSKIMKIYVLIYMMSLVLPSIAAFEVSCIQLQRHLILFILRLRH